MLLEAAEEELDALPEDVAVLDEPLSEVADAPLAEPEEPEEPDAADEADAPELPVTVAIELAPETPADEPVTTLASVLTAPPMTAVVELPTLTMNDELP